jgi:hypothetical protein
MLNMQKKGVWQGAEAVMLHFCKMAKAVLSNNASSRSIESEKHISINPLTLFTERTLFFVFISHIFIRENGAFLFFSVDDFALNSHEITLVYKFKNMINQEFIVIGV